MRFCVIGRARNEENRPPRKDFLRLVEKEWKTVLQWLGDGQVQEACGFADGTGGLLIVDVGDGEGTRKGEGSRGEGAEGERVWACEEEARNRVEAMVRQLPLYPHAHWEIKRLLTAEEGLEKARRLVADRDGGLR